MFQTTDGYTKIADHLGVELSRVRSWFGTNRTKARLHLKGRTTKYLKGAKGTISTTDKPGTVAREWEPEELAFLEKCYAESNCPNYSDIARALRALLTTVVTWFRNKRALDKSELDKTGSSIGEGSVPQDEDDEYDNQDNDVSSDHGDGNTSLSNIKKENETCGSTETGGAHLPQDESNSKKHLPQIESNSKKHLPQIESNSKKVKFFTAPQLDYLKECYGKSMYQTKEDYERIAIHLHDTATRVKEWFNSARKKESSSKRSFEKNAWFREKRASGKRKLNEKESSISEGSVPQHEDDNYDNQDNDASSDHGAANRSVSFIKKESETCGLSETFGAHLPQDENINKGKRFATSQLDYLKKCYGNSMYQTKEEYARIALHVQETTSRVMIWFHNARKLESSTKRSFERNKWLSDRGSFSSNTEKRKPGPKCHTQPNINLLEMCHKDLTPPPPYGDSPTVRPLSVIQRAPHTTYPGLLLHCPHCSFSVSSNLHFDLHLATHATKTSRLAKVPVDPSYPRCEICGYIAMDDEDFEGHVFRHMEEQMFVCAYCPRDFSSVADAKTHCELCHPRQAFCFRDRGEICRIKREEVKLIVLMHPTVCMEMIAIDTNCQYPDRDKRKEHNIEDQNPEEAEWINIRIPKIEPVPLFESVKQEWD